MKKNIDVEKLCKMFLTDKYTIAELAEAFNTSIKTINGRLDNSGNEQVLALRSKRRRNPSEVVKLNDDMSFLVTNNTKNKFYFPSYLYKTVSNRAWNETNGYAKTKINNMDIKLHNLVYGHALKPYAIDHKDRNKFNNMHDNFRVTTYSMNLLNRKTARGASGYKGARSANNKPDRWQSFIRINYEIYSLGVFNTPEEASLRHYEVKSNLFGFEYMSQTDIDEYNYLLNHRSTRTI